MLGIIPTITILREEPKASRARNRLSSSTSAVLSMARAKREAVWVFLAAMLRPRPTWREMTYSAAQARGELASLVIARVSAPLTLAFFHHSYDVRRLARLGDGYHLRLL